MKFLLGLFALGIGLCLANAQEPTKAIAVLHPTAGNKSPVQSPSPSPAMK